MLNYIQTYACVWPLFSQLESILLKKVTIPATYFQSKHQNTQVNDTKYIRGKKNKSKSND